MNGAAPSIQITRLSQHLALDGAVDSPPGNQINWLPEKQRQLLSEGLDLSSQAHP